MGLNMRGGDKSSLALLSNKRTKAYSKTQADEAFALPSFSDTVPDTTTELQQHRMDRSRSNAVHGLVGTLENLLEDTAAEPQHYREQDTISALEPCDPTTACIADDAQNLRQTMLQHESLFKEQLSELHRLYQKQCWLMAESKRNGSACHPRRPEPPSSNSPPFNCMSTNLAHEERSLGDAGVTKAVCKQDHFVPSSHSGLGPWVVRSKMQGQQESGPVLNIEPPATTNGPILNLELPTEEYVGDEEKAVEAGGRCRGAQEKRSGNPELSLRTGYDVRMGNGYKQMYSSSNEKALKRYAGQFGFFQDEYQENNKVASFPLKPAEYTQRESTLGSVQADEPLLCMQSRTEATHKERVHVNVQVERSQPWALPGWLSQGSSTSMIKTGPLNLSSDEQQKDKWTLPMMHGQGSHSSKLSSGYGEKKTSSATEELLYPFLQSRTSSQGNFPRGIFGAANNMTRNVGLPSGGLISDVRDMQGLELQTPPEELFTRPGSITTSTVLPCYVQSSFRPRQPKPEPSGQRLMAGVSHVIGGHKLHQWETAKLGVTMSDSMKGNISPKREEVGKPFCLGQVSQGSGEKCGLPNLNSRLDDFDLNVSVSPCPAEEEDSHACFLKQNSGPVNIEGLRQQHETDERSLGCTGTRAPPFFEQQSMVPTNEETAHAMMGNDTFCTGMVTKSDGFCSQMDRHVNGACTCIEGEMGERLVGGKNSDGSGLTSCDSRDTTPVEARDQLNLSGGEACQSRESLSLWHEEDDNVALSSNSQLRMSADMALLDDDASGIAGRSQQSTVENPSSIAQHKLKRLCFADRRTDFGEESEAANSTSKGHSVDMTEAAQLLLSLGSDQPSLDMKGQNSHGGQPDSFTHVIRQEEMPRATGLAGGDMAGGMAMAAGISAEYHTLEDPFESAVVMLKLVDPESECIATNCSDGGDTAGRCLASPHLRRGLSQRVKAVTKELRRGAMSSLSRQEITEDLKFMEGMIKSCNIKKRMGGACSSWGESIRRRRQRGRRRSRWMSLPLPVVQV